MTERDVSLILLQNARSNVPEGSVWLHLKTGNEYRVTGHAMIESTWSPGVLYRRNVRSPAPQIIRDFGEFTDGRFERVT